MSLNRKIRKILKEEVDTSILGDKFTLGLIKFVLKNIQKHYPGHLIDEFRNLDNFIDDLIGLLKKNPDKVFDKLFYVLDDTMYGSRKNNLYLRREKNPLLEGIPTEQIVKWVYEFLLNYENSGERIEVNVIQKGYDFDNYVKENFYNCDKPFFRFVWEQYLDDDIKNRLWGDFLPLVEEKIDDVDWQEENGVSFDSLDNEYHYFKDYWHYPIDNLGWDNYDLCEYYKDVIEMKGRHELPVILTTAYDDLSSYNHLTKKIFSEVHANNTFYVVFNGDLFG